MNRMILEFPRIETLEGVTRTPYNQYESVILPLKAYLDGFGVDFSIKAVDVYKRQNYYRVNIAWVSTGEHPKDMVAKGQAGWELIDINNDTISAPACRTTWW